MKLLWVKPTQLPDVLGKAAPSLPYICLSRCIIILPHKLKVSVHDFSSHARIAIQPNLNWIGKSAFMSCGINHPLPMCNHQCISTEHAIISIVTFIYVMPLLIWFRYELLTVIHLVVKNK